MDDFRGANLNADLITIWTIGLTGNMINFDLVIDERNRFCRTFLNTKLALNTAHQTGILDRLALLLSQTGEQHPVSPRYHIQTEFGAGFHA